MTSCPICFETVGGDDRPPPDCVPARLVCQHAKQMHEACLARWLTFGSGCPVCRAPGARRLPYRPPPSLVSRLLAFLRRLLRWIGRAWRPDPWPLGGHDLTVYGLADLRRIAERSGARPRLRYMKRPGQRLNVRADYAEVLGRALADMQRR
jgi:hypothetical protein